METPEMPMHVGSLSMFQLPKGYKGDFFEAFKAQIADRLALLVSHGLPLDHVERTLARAERLAGDELLAAAQRWLRRPCLSLVKPQGLRHRLARASRLETKGRLKVRSGCATSARRWSKC